ncbi:hypothetical protein DPMN_181281 [Dreissena polymorpha]|uniref:Uncharacterized protein n=1 Tax=Dreissena polymorpha TaxID=45954 RepID=A0A9D4DCJ2_DREPO|nr:hypothetical protein DPMN_181281 [Dreissena polymorpha]
MLEQRESGKGPPSGGDQPKEPLGKGKKLGRRSRPQWSRPHIHPASGKKQRSIN